MLSFQIDPEKMPHYGIFFVSMATPVNNHYYISGQWLFSLHGILPIQYWLESARLGQGGNEMIVLCSELTQLVLQFLLTS